MKRGVASKATVELAKQIWDQHNLEAQLYWHEEYWAIKEQFGILRNIAKYMDSLREIRTLYPNTENMTLNDVEDFLTNRYTELNTKLAKDLNLRDETPSETWGKLIKKVETKSKN